MALLEGQRQGASQQECPGTGAGRQRRAKGRPRRSQLLQVMGVPPGSVWGALKRIEGKFIAYWSMAPRNDTLSPVEQMLCIGGVGSVRFGCYLRSKLISRFDRGNRRMSACISPWLPFPLSSIRHMCIS